MRVLPLILLIMMPFAFAQESDKERFDKAIDTGQISGTGLQGTVLEDGTIRITGGQVSSIPPGKKVMVDSENGVTVRDTVFKGKAYITGSELSHGSSGATLELSRIMTEVEMLKDGTFLVKTLGPEVKMQSGTVQQTKFGYAIIVDSLVTNIGSGIRQVDATRNDITIDGKQLVFTKAYPQNIESRNGLYYVDIGGKTYSTLGMGTEFLLDRINVPEGSSLGVGSASFTAKTGGFSFHFNEDEYRNSKKNAVFISEKNPEQKEIFTRVFETGEIDVITPKGEHQLIKDGDEKMLSSVKKDAKMQISKMLNALSSDDIAAMKKDSYSLKTYSMQWWLNDLGYYNGPRNGIMKEDLVNAFNRYLADNGVDRVDGFSDTTLVTERLAEVSRNQQTDNYIVILQKSDSSIIKWDDIKIASEKEIVGRTQVAKIREQRKQSLDRQFEDSAPRIDSNKEIIDTSASAFFSDYPLDKQEDIIDHMIAKMVKESQVGDNMANLWMTKEVVDPGSGELKYKQEYQTVSSTGNLKKDTQKVNSMITEPLNDDQLSRSAFGPGQLTLERFVHMLQYSPELRGIAGIQSAPTDDELNKNKDKQKNLAKQQEYIAKLLDPDIGIPALAVSTKYNLEVCKGDLDCESAIHNAGQGNVRAGMVFSSETAYLRSKAKEKRES